MRINKEMLRERFAAAKWAKAHLANWQRLKVKDREFLLSIYREYKDQL